MSDIQHVSDEALMAEVERRREAATRANRFFGYRAMVEILIPEQYPSHDGETRTTLKPGEPEDAMHAIFEGLRERGFVVEWGYATMRDDPAVYAHPERVSWTQGEIDDAACDGEAIYDFTAAA